jgi:hypothetical protein
MDDERSMDDETAPEIAAALEKLAQDDPSAAREAEPALRWLAGAVGLPALTQERLQSFLWYQLPVKWITGLDDKLHIAASLARVLDLLQLPRYAAICRSETTRAIIEAYETNLEHGKAATRKAFAASGVEPPDLPDFEWGPIRGVQEMWAWSSVAEFLEVAVASGELVPGARGWKTRQQDLVRAYLSTPQPDLLGQTFAQAILTERAESWVNLRRSQTRRQLVAALANRLLHPARLPEGTTEPLPRVRLLFDALDGGIPLTVRGNLNRKFVQLMADPFGWNFDRPPSSEDNFYDLHIVRELIEQLRLARRTGDTLTLSTKGRQVAADPEQLWRTVSAGLLPENLGDFTLYAGELFLVLLLAAEYVPYVEITATVHRAAVEESFANSQTGEPPDEDEVSWAVHDTLNLCRALGLLAESGDWGDRRYGLTEIGQATALEALRSRATGPRTVPPF